MGHRYRIIATCSGPVVSESGNPENGMVIDFGNIKKYMMDILDSVFDHGFVVYKGDKAMMDMFFPGKDHSVISEKFKESWNELLKNYQKEVINGGDLIPLFLNRTKYSEQDPDGMKVIIVDYVPTAENLAKHFFEMLAPIITAHYKNSDVELINIRLYETPNGYVDYPGIGLA